LYKAQKALAMTQLPLFPIFSIQFVLFHYIALVRISMSDSFQLRNEASLHIYYNADDSTMQLWRGYCFRFPKGMVLISLSHFTAVSIYAAHFIYTLGISVRLQDFQRSVAREDAVRFVWFVVI